MHMDMLIRGGRVVTADESFIADVAVENGGSGHAVNVP